MLIQFELPEGNVVIINPAMVRYIEPWGVQQQCKVSFAVDDYIIVNGPISEIASRINVELSPSS